MYKTILVLSIAVICGMLACKHKLPEPEARDGGFPKEIAHIFITKCATSGCHNTSSYAGAAGLLLESWSTTFRGGNSGAVIIPYDVTNSSLLYFINTYAHLGPTASPAMPLNEAPLSEAEYMQVYDWIKNGAPDEAGLVPFSENPATRQKIYLTQQGCDLLSVIDAESNLVMRNIPIGKNQMIESPHCVRVSKDGKYAYVSFLSGEYIQKIDATEDKVVDELYVGAGSWNVFLLSPDGNRMILSDWQGNGRILDINTQNMTINNTYSGNGVFVFPHGVAANASFDTFFVTAQYGNVVYKISPATGYYKRVSLDSDNPVTISGKRDPHEIMMTPDCSKYIVTCEASDEVRIMDAYADTLIKAIPVGVFPQEIALSVKVPYFFITCTEDASAIAGYKGSVYAVNYNTYETTRIDGRFYQPHGITVDDKNGILYIASRNASLDGPAPHHASSCSGRNGWYSVYDIHTLKPYNNKRYEVSVEPYSADTRFK